MTEFLFKKVSREKGLIIILIAFLIAILIILQQSKTIRLPELITGFLGTPDKAVLSLSPNTGTYKVGDQFSVDVYLDTKGNNVVAVGAYLNYDPANLQVISVATTSSIFDTGYEIINYNGSASHTPTGTIEIVKSKPSPGVNTSNGLVAAIRFKALSAINPGSDNVTFSFAGAYVADDSDVMLDDGQGTDILSGVDNGKYTITDAAPPSAVTNLATSNPSANSITLTWTSPGDDGNTGTASQYDIRYSTSIIDTDVKFNSASQATGEPAPKVSGSSETFTVTGLSSNTTYYFALKTSDEVPNWSNISNSPSGKTLITITVGAITGTVKDTFNNPIQGAAVSDGTRSTATGATGSYTLTNVPAGAYTLTASKTGYQTATSSAAVTSGATTTLNFTLADTTSPTDPTGLTATAVSSSQINLSWTASTDGVGVTGYQIFRCTGSICTPSTQTGTSTINSYSDTGLLGSTTYRYRVRAYDAAGNLSNYSSIASATTSASLDTTSPAAVTNLAVGTKTSNSITLTWTSPGDDGNTGTASQYDIRYSTSIIDTDVKFNSATQATGEPSPKISGSSETFTVTGLSPNTTYYFAVKTADEVPNWSNISNSPSGKTKWRLRIKVGLEGKQTYDTSLDLYILNLGTNINVYSPISGATIATGEFETDISLDDLPAGNYDLKIVAPYYLSKKISGVTWPSGTEIQFDDLLAGDLQNDGIINSLDWSVMNGDWRKSNVLSDINRDGVVNALDWGYLNKNWALSGG